MPRFWSNAESMRASWRVACWATTSRSRQWAAGSVPGRRGCGGGGKEEPIASVVGEILPGAEFYDYRAKYLDTGSQALIPADISPDLADEVRRMAVAAFKAVDAAGAAPVDFFLGPRTAALC